MPPWNRRHFGASSYPSGFYEHLISHAIPEPTGKDAIPGSTGKGIKSRVVAGYDECLKSCRDHFRPLPLLGPPPASDFWDDFNSIKSLRRR